VKLVRFLVQWNDLEKGDLKKLSDEDAKRMAEENKVEIL